jgi:hypothetical protein
MSTESARIADQLRRAVEGQAWHGSSIKEILEGIGAEQSSARPIADAHSIWELVSHMAVWTDAAAQAVDGVPMPKIVGTDKDWPPVNDAGEPAWKATKARLFAACANLAGAMDRFDDARLEEAVPGRRYDFYHLFHGIVQHSLYHAGQIALLKKSVAGQRL